MTPKRLLTLMLWVIIVGLIIPLYFRIALDDPIDYSRGGLGAGDFKEYYIAARLMERNQNIYDASLQAHEMDALSLPRDDLGYRQTAYLYPSILATVLMPLAALPITDAARLWNLMNLTLLAITLFLITDALDLRQYLRNHYPWLIVLFAMAYPTIVSLRIGQINIVILFLLVLCLWAQRHHRSALVGVGIGTAALLKIFPLGLLALPLFRKDYRAIVWGASTIGGLLLSNAVFLSLTGRNPAIDLVYFTQVLPHLNTSFVLDNQSVNGFISWLVSSSPARYIALILSSVLIVILTTIALAYSKHDAWSLDFSILLTMFLLIFPITWWSTLILLLVPFATLLRVWAIKGKPLPLILGLGLSYLLLNSSHVLEIVPPLSNLSWLIRLPFWGMLLLWGMMIGMVLYAHRDACEKSAS